MNVLLWIVAGLLAAVFLAAGILKLTRPRQKLIDTLAWPEDFSQRTIKMIGTLELLGAIGLILPAALNIAPVFVPLAATGLVLLMAGAVITHIRRHEPQGIAVTTVLGLLAAFVAWGRFGPYSF